MKVSTAQRILKTLPPQKWDEFWTNLRRVSGGIGASKLAKFLRENEELQDEVIIMRLRITRGQYAPRLRLIARQLSFLFAGNRKTVHLTQDLEFAQELLRQELHDQAADVMRMGIRYAAEIEEFDLVVRFWRLTMQFPHPPKIDYLDADSARLRRDNLNQLSNLLERLEIAAKNKSAKERRKFALEALALPVLASPEQALSHRASFCFWKCKVYAFKILQEYAQALSCQEVLIGIVQEHPWMFGDHEYELAKVMTTQAILLRCLGWDDRYQQVCAEFLAMPLRSPRAVQERVYLRFPFSIGTAIDKGNLEEGITAVQEFLELYASSADSYTPEFLTDNLYFGLYCAIAARRDDLRVRITRLLSHHNRPHFRAKFYPMFRFMGIIRAIEERDPEEAHRLIRNYRKTNGMEELSGMKELMDFLMELVTAWLQAGNAAVRDQVALVLTTEQKARLLSIMHRSDVNDHFDMVVWFESLEKDCPMMDIFHHRAQELRQESAGANLDSEAGHPKSRPRPRSSPRSRSRAARR